LILIIRIGTHYPIAKYAIEHKLHVLVTKPATQLLSHHNELISLAEKNGVVCWVEHHKRYDPAYSDARGEWWCLSREITTQTEPVVKDEQQTLVNSTSSMLGCLSPSHSWRRSAHGLEKIPTLGLRIYAI
jgi:hypothetical protein